MQTFGIIMNSYIVISLEGIKNMKLSRKQIQRLILREMAEMGMDGITQTNNVNDPRVALVKAYLAGYEVCESGGGRTGSGGVYPEGIFEPLIEMLESMGYSDPFAEGVGSELVDDFLRSRGYN